MQISPLASQMSNIKVPIAAISHMNVTVRSMSITDLINANTRRKNVYNHGVIKRNKTSA